MQTSALAPATSGSLRTPLSRRSRRGNSPSEIALGGVEREERSDQEVEGHGRVAGLHLRDAGLAGPQLLRQLDLRQLQRLTPLAQPAAERELELDETGLLRRQAEKLRGRADLPAPLRQLLSLYLIHRRRYTRPLQYPGILR